MSKWLKSIVQSHCNRWTETVYLSASLFIKFEIAICSAALIKKVLVSFTIAFTIAFQLLHE